MASGPEHYREAERLLEQAEVDARDPMRKYAEDANLIAAAQVHATLALTAATVECASDLTPPQDFAGNGNYITQGGNAQAWREATS